MRLNLNTVDYSQKSTPELIATLNELFWDIAHSEDYEDYQDKREDVWSELYKRKQANPEQYARVDELIELAEKGALDDDDVEALIEGFLP